MIEKAPLRDVKLKQRNLEYLRVIYEQVLAVYFQSFRKFQA